MELLMDSLSVRVDDIFRHLQGTSSENVDVVGRRSDLCLQLQGWLLITD